MRHILYTMTENILHATPIPEHIADALVKQINDVTWPYVSWTAVRIPHGDSWLVAHRHYVTGLYGAFIEDYWFRNF